jgi:hypothetical protein
MTIGIITFLNTKDNYGQALQCYALQKFLTDAGHKPYLIKYEPKYFVRNITIFLHNALFNRKLKTKKTANRSFSDFFDKNIQSTSLVYHSWNQLNSNPPQADCYICGSDQIWNPIDYPHKNTKPWFLDFGGNVKRISYAASFGQTDLTQNLTDFIAPMLARFDAISVREKSGIKICSKAGRNNAVCVLDPTLLLDKTAYLHLAEKSDWKEKYILGYFVNVNETTSQFWNTIFEYTKSKNFELKIVPVQRAENHIPYEDFSYPSIPQWLSAYNEAEEILTTSFHGVAFSIIFHKQFLVFPIYNSNSKLNDRFFSLLEQLELTDRIYNPDVSIKEQMNKDINWADVDIKLQNLRQKSQNFLLTALSK